MFANIAKYSALAVAVTVLLTGCTPPPPPEVLAAWAEQTPTCIEGDSSVFLPHEVVDSASSLTDAVSLTCDGSDPKTLAAMSATLTESIDDADIVVATDGNFGSKKAYATVPWAVDAAVLVANLPNNSSLNLTPAIAEGILDGKITDWSDPAIAKANPDETFEAGPITVSQASTQNVIDSFKAWMTHLGAKDFTASKLKAQASVGLDALDNLAIGSVALLPLSLKTEFDINAEMPFISASVIIADPADPKASIPVAADSVGVASAATQMVLAKDGDSLVAKLDYSLAPTPPAGADTADPAYGAVFAVYMKLVGKDTLTNRAVARFLLRQDEQGVIGSTYLLPIAEQPRIEALAWVSKGLPEPILVADN
jgi:phosphate transport system substrate-binding protein